MKNLHVPLPDDLHSALMSSAKVSGESATAIARAAIEKAVKERQREERRSRIAADAAQWAGTPFDLDPELEQAGLDTIREGA